MNIFVDMGQNNKTTDHCVWAQLGFHFLPISDYIPIYLPILSFNIFYISPNALNYWVDIHMWQSYHMETRCHISLIFQRLLSMKIIIPVWFICLKLLLSGL